MDRDGDLPMLPTRSAVALDDHDQSLERKEAARRGQSVSKACLSFFEQKCAAEACRIADFMARCSMISVRATAN